MDIQNKIVKIIIVLQEAGQGLTKAELQSTLLGQQNKAVEAKSLDQLNSFGICNDSEEGDWLSVFDRAIEEKLLKIKNQKRHTLTYTQDGKKFRKKPHPVFLGAGGVKDFGGVDDPELLAMMRGNAGDSHGVEQKLKSSRSKRQIKLLQAIDRKIALDDFAQGENIDLDQVLDDLEDLKAHDNSFDITYFIYEIINKDDVQEFRESMTDGRFDMKKARKEWGDVYSEEELRLLSFVI